MIYSLNDLKYYPGGLLLPQIYGPDHNCTFVAPDTKELFEQNLKTQPADWHYRTKKVTYNVNSQLYRAPEWNTIDWERSIVIFGCSIVYGIGVDETETLSYYLSNIMNRPVINLGSPSTGILYAMQNQVMLHRSAYPMPWAVVNLWSDPYRMHEFRQTDIATYTAHSKHAEKSFEFAWGKHEMNPEIHSFFAIKAAEAMWHTHSKYISFTFWKQLTSSVTEFRFPEYDFARDLVHPGPKQLLEMAEIIANDLNDK